MSVKYVQEDLEISSKQKRKGVKRLRDLITAIVDTS